MRRVACALAATAVLVHPAGASAADVVRVHVDPSRITTTLGHEFSFRATITNRGSEVARGYIAHLNVLSYDRGTYVDPEDWSGERTRYLPPLPAGAATTITWQMQAVNDGRFAVYVSVVPPPGSSERATPGPVIAVAVAERRTLDSDGILPLVVGMPVLLGAAWLGLRVARRRSSPAPPTDVGRIEPY